MITRGLMVGNIVDHLSDLQRRIDFRCQLGLTDLNKFCEDFIKEVLNLCYNLKLKNLNDERSNAPGLDLGDLKNKIAFQVTSTGNSDKVNRTLEAIRDEQLAEYSRRIVFILGEKQGTYNGVDGDLSVRCSFDWKRDIWDFTDLCKNIISLKHDVLYELHQLFEKQFQSVLIEIEIPNKEGKYPTNLSDKLEVVPNTMSKNANAYLQENDEASFEEVQTLFQNLSKLPRLLGSSLK